MHFNLKGALGIAVPALLFSALAVGAAALPASATTWQDTSLSATAVQAATFGGGTLGARNGTGVITLSSTGGVTWSLHGTVPSGVTLVSATSIGYSGTTALTANIVADATDSAGNAEALVIPVATGTNSIHLGTGSVVTVSLSKLAAANTSGTVVFSATSSASSNTITFAQSNLPAGLVSGNPLTYVGGNAAPGTYSGVKVTATDSDGAVLNGTFSLTVQANTVTTNNGTVGDEVNKFGYGFDSYRQHDYAGAIIVGWNTSSSDPATHFLMNSGSHSGYVQFEYAPTGSGSGLCVSDPGGGWGSDPLRDGLILTNCNSGPFQQFLQQSDGTLVNLATGLIVNPAGKGGQLRGGSSAVGWGGSSYTWESGQ